MAVEKRLSLVTGGTGFIGRNLVEHLISRGERVRVIGRRPVVRWRRNPSVEHIRSDISTPGVVEAALEGVGTVYHLAAATQGNEEYYEKVTVGASKRLLQTLGERKGGRIIFVSSLSVYDAARMRDGVVVDEDFPLDGNPRARGLYARTKTEAEAVARKFLSHSNVKLTIVRPGLVYGPGNRHPLNGAALSLKGRLWLAVGKPGKHLPLLHVGDLANLAVGIADCPATVGRIYNLFHSEMPTVAEFLQFYRQISQDRRPIVSLPLSRMLLVFRLIDRLEKVVGRKSNYLAAASRLVGSPEFSAERVERESGLKPETSWRQGLAMTYGS